VAFHGSLNGVKRTNDPFMVEGTRVRMRDAVHCEGWRVSARVAKRTDHGFLRWTREMDDAPSDG